MRIQRQPHNRNEAGIALLLALVFIVLLAAIVTNFMYKIQVDATIVASNSSDYEALLAAKSGVATALSVLHADRVGNTLDAEENPEEFGMYDALSEVWAEPGNLATFNDDVVSMTIVDEYSKLNLNALIFEASNGEQSGEVVHDVLELAIREVFRVDLGFEEDPTDLILDWLDADDDARPNGAESDYYESLDPPFSCKNGPMDSIEELLLLPGITPEVYFGLPDPDLELELDDEGEILQPIPLSDLFTVHGHPEGRLNINTTSEGLIEVVLMASESLYPGTITTDMTIIQNQMASEYPFFSSEAQLIQNRYLPSRLDQNGQAIQGGGDVDQNVGFANENNQNSVNAQSQIPLPPPMFTVESNVFRIFADGQSNDAQVRVEVYAFRDPSDKEGATEPQLFRILDWRVIR
jgi:hypothetical protein